MGSGYDYVCDNGWWEMAGGWCAYNPPSTHSEGGPAAAGALRAGAWPGAAEADGHADATPWARRVDGVPRADVLARRTRHRRPS